MGPLLSSAKMSLSVIDTSALSEADRDTIRGTTQVIDEALRSLREISNNLSPQVLSEFGLGKGINNFTSKVSAINKINFDIKSNLGARRYGHRDYPLSRSVRVGRQQHQTLEVHNNQHYNKRIG